MFLYDLPELKLYPVDERGVPNLERIVIYANDSIHMGQYGVMLGRYAGNATATPINDNLFWFGDGTLKADEWIVIYTGKGHPNVSKHQISGSNVYNVFWNREMTMFTNTELVPILFRINAVTVDIPPLDKPQKLAIPYTS